MKKPQPREVDSLLPALDDPSDFLAPSLRAVDHSLRCSICANLFTAPVLLTTCSHAFDSLCLRQHLATTKRCPTCHVEANEDRIKPDHALEEVVRNWAAARTDILALQATASHAHASASTSAGPSSCSSPTPVASSSRLPSTTKPAPLTSDRGSKRKAVKTEPTTTQIETLNLARSDNEVEVQSPPRKKMKDVKGKGRAKTPSKGSGDLTDPNLVVSCPICSASVKNGHLNKHIDSGCAVGALPAGASAATGGANGMKTAWTKLLSSRGGKGAPSSESDIEAELNTSERLPLAHYTGKKVKELQNMLRALNLPLNLPPTATSFESKTALLSRRHQRFTTLWNANADVSKDSPAHKTAKELRGELEEWEKTMEKGARKAEKRVGGMSDREYLREHAEQFRELIAQARASAQAAKEKHKSAAVQQDPAAVEKEKQEMLDARDPTPTLDSGAGPEEDVEMDDSIVIEEHEPAKQQDQQPAVALPPPPSSPSPARTRSRTVRLVSPLPSPTPSTSSTASASAQPRAASPVLSLSPSPPPFFHDPRDSPPLELDSQRARAAQKAELLQQRAKEREERERRERERSRSREGDEGEEGEEEEEEEGAAEGARWPRPSQRNREEEDLWARVEARKKEVGGLKGVVEEEEEDE